MTTYQPKPEIAKKAFVKSNEAYEEMYQKSLNPKWWGELAKKEFYWVQPFTEENVVKHNFSKNKGKVNVEWFKDGKTNICYNCIDRHLEKQGDKVAYHWVGNDGEKKNYTYKEMHREICKVANAYKKMGIKKGDRIAFYMPMVVELAIAMLAAVRIGAIHSVVFGGFSAQALAARVLDSECKMIITTDAVMRGTKKIHLKKVVDEAVALCKKENYNVEHVIVYNRLGEAIEEKKEDIMWDKFIEGMSDQCDVEWVWAEDPLFMLYTSGSTGKPKGLIHTHGGYMVYAGTTHKYIFDIHKEEDIYWCGADIGWITGHTYILYGPLLNGATSIFYEGTPTCPDPSICWKIIEEYKVTQFYTAPTVIRSLMVTGKEPVKKHDRSSLRVMGSVGEPINPEAWEWYYKVVGEQKASIVDTYWQTETGGIIITPLPGATPMKPGSATKPFFGIDPVLLDAEGKLIPEGHKNTVEGFLAIRKPWPGIARTCYKNHDRYEAVYFSRFDGYYVTGDACKRDADGYYWIIGRVDDVLNVSGHRLGTAEIESAIVSHQAVAEAAVVPVPHPIKGQAIYAFVTTVENTEYTEALKKEINDRVRKELGAIASLQAIHWAPGLPKTRSGKIMRRVLRKIAVQDNDQLGDLSTIADDTVIASLIQYWGQ